MNKIGLGSYLAFILAGLMVLLTLIIVSIVSAAATQEVETKIGLHLEELAFQTTDKLDRGMFERYREVQLIAERNELADPAVPVDEKRALLEQMQQTHPHYAWLGLTDNQGKVLVASGKLLEGKDVSQRPWFGNAYRNVHLNDVHDAVLLAKLLPNPTNEPMRFFDVAFPYRTLDGKIAGVFGVHLSWQWAQEVEKSVLRPLARRSNVDTLIVGKDGTVLLGPPELLGSKISQASFTAAQAQKVRSVQEQWPDGKQYLVGYSKSVGYRDYPGFGWTVLVRQPTEDAYRPVDELNRTILWSGLLAAVVFALIGFWVARRIASPLCSIADKASDIESGKATRVSVEHDGYCEITTLAGSLNSLLQKLTAKERSLSELNATLEQRVETRTVELAQALAELKSSESRVHAIIESAQDAFVGMDSDGCVTDWNPQAENIFGWSRAEIVGKKLATAIIPARYRDSHTQGMARFIATGKSRIAGNRIELSAIRRNGEEFPTEMTIGIIKTAKGNFFGAFIQDISVRKRIEQNLLDSQRRLSTLADNMPATILYIDRDECYQFSNQTYETWLGRPAHSIYGKTVEQVFREQGYGEDVYQGVRPSMRRALAGEKTILELQRVIHGRNRHLEATYIPHWDADGTVAGFYAMIQDVTERKIQELQLEHYAMHDALTGLPNRKALMDRLEQAIARMERGRKALAVMFLDLDKFKQINDTHGHVVGDQVLIAFAERLKKCVRKTDTVARLAGDEFVIVAENMTQGEDNAATISEKIIAALKIPLLNGEPTIVGSTSIGIALATEGNETAEELLNCADQAMYLAKQEKMNSRCVSVKEAIV